MKQLERLSIAFAASWWLTACGTVESSAPPPPESGAREIIGGVPDTGDPEVFQLYIQGNNNMGAGCTATLIDRRTLLTAAHCVDPRTIGATAVQLLAHNKANDGQVGFSDLIRVTETRMHPQWSGQGQHDIALALLQTAPANVTPKPWNSASINQKTGQPIRVVGYGANMGGAMPTGSGVKRQTNLTFRQIFTDVFFLGDGLAKGVCHGDSGGPSFHTFSDGVERVVGVHSFTTTEACLTGADARVDFYASFIRQWLTDKESPLCSEDGRCAQGCATPDLDCLCARDGQCNPACPDVAKDPDCPVNCATNGVCALEACPRPDTDCVASGLPCSTDLQCPGRRCAGDAQHEQKYCTGACSSSAECWSGSECDLSLGTCRYTYVPETPVGESCTPYQSFCALNSRCNGPTPDYAYCSWRCATQAECPGNTTCEAGFDGSKYCRWPPKPAVVLPMLTYAELGAPASCSSAAGLLPVLALLLLLRRRRA